MPTYSGFRPADVRACAAHLAAGKLVAFATETVYGLGANALDDAAVAGIFAAKGRPADHPLIVHVASPQAAQHFCTAPGAAAESLMTALWPGPLTVIVPRQQGVAAAAAGGQASIGLRMPAHPVALALLREAAALGVWGVAAPSANRFGRISPTTAAHVAAELGSDLWVLDGGPCDIGIESTIVDCTRQPPTLLRPGHIGQAALQSLLGTPLGRPDAASPRAPGTLLAHYAPRAPLWLCTAAALHARLAGAGHAGSRNSGAVRKPPPAGQVCEKTREALETRDAREQTQTRETQETREAPEAGSVAKTAGVYSRSFVVPCGAVKAWRRMPADPSAAAHELFSVLREFDALNVSGIWVENPPDTPEWDGVRDRLQRAAAAS